MKPQISKLTSKYQATIPETVRKALQINAGDAILFEVTGATVQVRKAHSIDYAFARALEDTLGEWSCKEDEEAWRDL